MLQENQTIKRVDMIHCALCADAPCNDACNEIEPSDILRSIWFKNEQTAALNIISLEKLLALKRDNIQVGGLNKKVL